MWQNLALVNFNKAISENYPLVLFWISEHLFELGVNFF